MMVIPLAPVLATNGKKVFNQSELLVGQLVMPDHTAEFTIADNDSSDRTWHFFRVARRFDKQAACPPTHV